MKLHPVKVHRSSALPARARRMRGARAAPSIYESADGAIAAPLAGRSHEIRGFRILAGGIRPARAAKRASAVVRDLLNPKPGERGARYVAPTARGLPEAKPGNS
ncbi:hypothetical protein J5Y09_12895 [Roseomonas sp. PWR1]|uniref:Uncharacterized protein n=1 Tax=Roseomonas nitratireducens TaxID=2820810 RepID=A0ABS4ATZ1_9PROT|nr:hypothetical protein [Neoroseomonas nitratireducens]MBP0464811.1 hypothetical protein [Neoroseomonas nitratireducens]